MLCRGSRLTCLSGATRDEEDSAEFDVRHAASESRINGQSFLYGSPKTDKGSLRREPFLLLQTLLRAILADVPFLFLHL
jgi:hypothetical protein